MYKLLIKNRCVILVFSTLIFSACKTNPILIVNELDEPINGVMVVEHEHFYAFPFLHRQWIKKTDASGIFYPKSDCNWFDFGKTGFYPVEIDIEEHNCPQKIVLKKKFDPTALGACSDSYDLLTENNLDFKWVPNKLWEEWFRYIMELDSKGYFTNYAFASSISITSSNIQNAIRYIEND